MINSNHSHVNPYYANHDFLPVMSREEEIEVGGKLSSEDEEESREAQEEFVNRNLRLVIKIATGYSKCGLELDDMVCEGNIGLMEAAKRFDPLRGAKFSTYAAYWIRQKITRALCNHGRLIRLPVQLVQLQLKVIKYVDSYSQKSDDEPSDEQIAEALGEPLHLVTKVLNSKYTFTSVDSLMGPSTNQSETASFGNVFADEKADSPLDSLVKNNDKEVINKFLDKLKGRERYVIEHRFGLNDKDIKTLEKIGEEFNVTRERIRQVQFEAMKKLRFAIQREYRK
jgi:RNA polymerase primary sigma factor